MRYSHCWIYILTSWLSASSCSAFVVLHNNNHPRTAVLWSKVKRAKLGKTVGTGMVTTNKKDDSKKKSKAVDISPDLANWIASNPQSSTINESDANSSSPTAAQKTSSRRERQNIRLAEEQVQREKMEGLVQQLEIMLDTTDNSKKAVSIDEILQVMRELTQQTASTPVTQLVAAKGGRRDYRLAWVGSDESVSHIGTGLHKVPLARLQEVFLSFPGSNRVLLQEVIRILGPFPNIRNTLSGSSQSSTRDGVTAWNVNWESMVDGTGKELLAGKEENVKAVPLQVYYSDAAAIIASRPCDDPWRGNGENLMLFLREEDLESKLEALRVA